MNTNLIKPHHEHFTEASRGNKEQFLVNFVAFCKVRLWIAILLLPACGTQAAAVLTTLYSFTGANDGANPYAGLIQGTDGYFYGTTEAGGASGFGTVFKISAKGAFTSLYSFIGAGQGAYPNALMQGSEGDFYGTTHFSVFQLTPAGALTTLAWLDTSNGPYPGTAGGLVQGSDGSFYSTTFQGGTTIYPGNGTVFKISSNGALTTLHSFTNGTDGGGPEGGLVQGSDGNFYGTAYYGGTNGGSGTVFKLSANGPVTTLYSFTGGNDGANPVAGLVQGSDGSFYGTAYQGGNTNRNLNNGIGYGTIFKITTPPEFQAAALTNGMLSLTWSTEAGGTYQLQCNSDLDSTNWINLRSPVTATGATLSTTDSLTNGSQRFYRLVLSQ